MNRRDRNKQKKKKARQARLRQEKHLRQSLPRGDEEDQEDEDLDEAEDLDELPLGVSPLHRERMLQDLQKAIAERGIETEEELQQFMAEYTSGLVASPQLGAAGGGDPKSRAQDLAYEAMEHPNFAESARLAREALQLDPDCVDALATLAGVIATSPGELITRLEEAVAIGTRALGADFFTANRGRFWGILETRPYMRTRASLAAFLQQAGRLPEAIGHYEALLELNPNDNQGNRDPLLACYLAAGNLEGARRLLSKYGDADMAVFAWARVLERYLTGDGAGAASALKTARTRNRHVEAFLTGARPIPKKKGSYYSPGQESEAAYAADFLRAAWQRHPDALTWLKTGKPPAGAAPG